MKIKQIIKFFFNELLLGGHVFTLGGVSVAISFMLILGLDINLPIAFSIYWFGQPIFFIDRYVGIDEDESGNLVRTKHVKKYHKYIPLLSAIYIGIFILWMVYWEMLGNLPMGLVMFGLGAMYGFVFKTITRNITGFKNVFVATFWMLFGFYTLLFFRESPFNSTFIIFTVFVFLRSLAIQVFLDIKDYESDKKKLLKTFYIVRGKKWVYRFITTLNILSSAVLIFGVFYDNFKLETLLLLIIPALFQLLVTKAYKRLSYKYLLITMFEYIISLIILLIGYGFS